MKHFKQKNRLLATVGIFSLMSVATQTAWAADTAEQLKAASLAATCANCHNTGGAGVEGAAVHGLSQLTSEYIAQQMQDFKSGKRPATVMHQLSKGYTDEQIQMIADYLGKK